MTKLAHVVVTQEMIDNGLPTISTKCPVAMAVSAALGREVSWLFIAGLIVNSTKQTVRSLDPAATKKFVIEFDVSGAKNVVPFEFDVEVEEDGE